MFHKSQRLFEQFNIFTSGSVQFFVQQKKKSRVARPRGSNKFNRFVKCHITHARDFNFTTDPSHASDIGICIPAVAKAWLTLVR